MLAERSRADVKFIVCLYCTVLSFQCYREYSLSVGTCGFVLEVETLDDAVTAEVVFTEHRYIREYNKRKWRGI